MSNIWQDLRVTMRMLVKNPGFAVTIVVTLALGIGINSSVFTIFDAVALRPLPVREPTRVVKIYQKVAGEAGYRSFSYPEYAALRDSTDSFSEILAYAWMPFEMRLEGAGGGARSIPIQALLVSDNYLSDLGAAAARGRTFTPIDAHVASDPVVVVSHSSWQRLFDSDPAVVGRRVSVNGVHFTVLGVAHSDFSGTEPQVPDFWIPLAFQQQLMPGDNRTHDKAAFWLEVAARMKPNVTTEQAASELTSRLGNAATELLNTDKQVVVSVSQASFLTRPDERVQVTSIGMMAFGAVTLILLIACANVANLLLVKAIERQRDIAIRISLGASRRRLIQQLLTESVALSTLGGVTGLLLASVLPQLLVRLLQPPGQHEINLQLSVNVSLLIYSFVLSLLTGILFGLAPVLQAGTFGQVTALKGEGSFLHRYLSRTSLRSILVVAQTALCLILVLGATLLVRGLQSATRIDPGFDTKDVLISSLNLQQYGYNEVRAAQFFTRLQDQLAQSPGVVSSSLASLMPLGGVSISAPVMLQDASSAAGVGVSVDYHVVSPSYFATLGIPLVSGRLFRQDDTMSDVPVAIVNEAMARQYWPGETALGKRFRPGPPAVPVVEVVGVVRNARLGRLWESDKPYIYLPVLSAAGGPGNQTSRLRMKLLVRVSDASIAGNLLPRLIREIDPAIQPSVDVLESNLHRWIWFSKASASIAAVLGAVALVLALVGIAGVASYDVARRTREIGIRMAIGATSGNILNWVLRRGASLAICGVLLGLLASAILARLLSAFLYSVHPLDPVSFVFVSLTMILIALAANFFPARRASKIDPIHALRND